VHPTPALIENAFTRFEAYQGDERARTGERKGAVSSPYNFHYIPAQTPDTQTFVDLAELASHFGQK
jgi:hypothetical protein